MDRREDKQDTTDSSGPLLGEVCRHCGLPISIDEAYWNHHQCHGCYLTFYLREGDYCQASYAN